MVAARKHVLVVEDDKNQRLLFGQELADEGYEVSVAPDGRSALTSVRERRPDLVVLDIAMPGMDGIETLGRILSKDSSIPVILHTAYSRYKDNFMTWSADAYVVKNSDLTEFRSTVHTLLHDLNPVTGKDSNKILADEAPQDFGSENRGDETP